MNGEATGQRKTNPNADAWGSLSLYDQARQNADENLRDDNEFIDRKLSKEFGYTEKNAAKERAERQALHDEVVAQINQAEQRMQNRTDTEYFTDFSGETNIDSETGKPRTRNAFDLYRKQTDESFQEYNDRLKNNSDMAALSEYIPMIEGEDAKNYSDRIKMLHSEFPREAGESADAYRERIKAADQDNKLLLVMANKMIDTDSPIAKTLQDDLNNIEDMKEHGRFGEDKAREFRREVLEKAIKSQWQSEQDEAKAASRAKLKERLEAKRKASGEKAPEDDNTGEQEDDKEALLRERQKNDERIKAIDEELAKLRGEMDRENKEMIKKLEKDLEEAKKVLEERKTDLAESYAKNRRLIVGAKNRAEFDANKRRYAEGLNEYLRAQAKLTYYKGQIDAGAKIESIRDKLAKRLESGEITAEEANKELGESWENINKSLQTDISAKFVEGFINEQKALEDSTIDKIDNGNLYRKIVSKIIDNKAIKTTLAIAGAAGLAATGIGLATGALALGGLSYTAGGVALGAGRGALSGLIMSRQSSKNSAVHNFVDEASIRKGLEGIDVNNGEDVANVANWLMKQYDSANQTDRGSNRKRTAIATGLGAVIGGVMSGVHIDQNVTKKTEYQRVVGEEPAEYHATNLENVNHAKGYGTQQFYRELGGDGDSYFSSGAHDAMAEVIKKYGMTVGENDWTYPGPVSEWPTAAREAFTEVANEWAKQGLVPATKIGGEPIYDTFTRTTNELISSKLHNLFVDGIAIAGAGALGGTISRMRNRAPANSEMPSLSPAAAPNEPMPTRPFAENATEQQPTNNTAEQQPTNNTPEQQPVANPEQQPANGANTSEQPDLAEAIRRSFLNEAGEDGVRFMTDTEGYTDAKGEQIANWWVNLSDGAKNDIVDYENSISSSPLGVALRQWLTLQGYNLNANR